MVTKEWVAIHRKHHRYVDGPLDPHSPYIYGILRVLFGGVLLYTAATKDEKVIEQYGAGTPDDWLERNIYARYSVVGVLLLLILNTFLFHGWGIVIWFIQMAWIPFWAAGVINGIGHWFGYRNNNTMDLSRNIIPFGFLIGGEELHNNHHDDPASPKLSQKWWEFDIGWMWLKLFTYMGLAKLVNR
jgi:stearoyl-CoA desaturase (delta-9 desaturase)